MHANFFPIRHLKKKLLFIKPLLFIQENKKFKNPVNWKFNKFLSENWDLGLRSYSIELRELPSDLNWKIISRYKRIFAKEFYSCQVRVNFCFCPIRNLAHQFFFVSTFIHRNSNRKLGNQPRNAFWKLFHEEKEKPTSLFSWIYNCLGTHFCKQLGPFTTLQCKSDFLSIHMLVEQSMKH